MAYTVTPEDMASITDVEMAFSTMRLLPDWNDIPEDFRSGNSYGRSDLLWQGAAKLQDRNEGGFRPSGAQAAVLH